MTRIPFKIQEKNTIFTSISFNLLIYPITDCVYLKVRELIIEVRVSLLLGKRKTKRKSCFENPQNKFQNFTLQKFQQDHNNLAKL